METNNKKRFCDDCGFKYDLHELRERRDGKWFCLRCVHRNQL